MNPIISIGRGVLEGAGIDQFMWGAAQMFPELKASTGIPIPGYDPAGIHYDDVIALAAGATLAGIGIATKKYNLSLEGVGMVLGSFIASQIQNLPVFTAGQIGGASTQAEHGFSGTSQATESVQGYEGLF